MVVYAAAANKRARQDEEEASTPSSSANAAALFLHAASAPPPFGDFEPISAVPISAVPPQQLPPVSGREEPPCLREHLLKGLGLRADLPVHFIDDKRLTGTDLDGAIRRLCPLLTPVELHAANLLFLPGAARGVSGRPRRGQEIKKPKAKGKVHGGLRVNLVGLDGGAKQELLLSRWDSSHATVVKGEGYLDFARRCGFREGDAVEVWAFVQRRFRLFGEDVCGDSLLHVLVVKKDQQPARCATATALSSLLHPRSIHRS
ncbi:hypothetical protein PAHAL_5G209200 [Panicum hallii]|uniref:Uncharacterized protein n=1 Tax=Panicum hallii TaxID=206008 RepID=A0A2S3HT03_9POAL|nr:hypothetical protein PAHAL_5G209200 [Panicum hallii]